jgi:SEC-C motif-containing protein
MDATGETRLTCVCGRGPAYRDCCGPLLARRAVAATAEQLMRSRFTAYATRDVDHLIATWHPDTRPREVTVDPAVNWQRLDIIEATAATSDRPPRATVEFRAYYDVASITGSQHEVSSFIRTETGWLYLDAN